MNEIIQKAELINAMIGKCSPDWEETTGMKFASSEESTKPDIDGYVFLKDKNLKVKLGIAGEMDGEADMIDGCLKEAYFSVDGNEYQPYSHFTEEYLKRMLEKGELLKEGEKKAKEVEKAIKKEEKEAEKELKALKKEYEVKAGTLTNFIVDQDSTSFGNLVSTLRKQFPAQWIKNLSKDETVDKRSSELLGAIQTVDVDTTATADADELSAPVAAEMFLDTDQFSEALKLVQDTQKSIKECHHSLLAIRGELDDARKAKMDEILSALQSMEHSFLDKVSNPICGPMDEAAAPLELSVEKSLSLDAPALEDGAPVIEEAPMEVMASTGAKEVAPLLNALRKLRHDDIVVDEVKKEWKDFFNAGNVPEFYLHTLDKIHQIGEEAKKEYNKKPIIK
jgi:hypothetical protein